MARKRVLIIEDDIELSELVRLRLEDTGYEVEIANRGDEGVQRARNKRPSIIVLDVFLPQMDGLTALKEIRYGGSAAEKEMLKDVPVIVMTGRASLMEEMFRLEGASEFLTKPIDTKELVGRVSKLIGLPDESDSDA